MSNQSSNAFPAPAPPPILSARETLARLRVQRIAQIEAEMEAKRRAIALNHEVGEKAARNMDDGAHWRRYQTAVDERAGRLYAEFRELERRRDAILAAQEAI